ncbi:MAG: GtrA family protein [Candidatus Liptonbacteria bacterium]|nr:GtrA family protein [Candidatus Liptonbacteria bacterium]
MQTITSRDWKAILIIGAGVGLLVQPLVANLWPVISLPFRVVISLGFMVLSVSIPLQVVIFLGFAVLAPVALWIAAMLTRWLPGIFQFAKFAAVGTLNSFVDLGVLNLQIWFFGGTAGLAYGVYKSVSFVVANANSFVWNKHWTFNEKKPTTGREALLFYLVAAAGWAVNVAVASVVVNYVAAPTSIAPKLWANIGAILGMVFSLAINFLGYKYLVFKEK